MSASEAFSMAGRFSDVNRTSSLLPGFGWIWLRGPIVGLTKNILFA